MKKIFKIILSIIILFSLSGCFNYKEINEYAIVSGISIDIDDKDPNKYMVGIQIMNAKKDKESDASLITIYKASGETIYGALEKIMLESPKELYLGHNEVIVISDTLLREKDPLDYLDFFMRDGQVEKDSLVMAAKDEKAYNVLKIITPLETIPSKNLKSTLSIADNYSGTLTIVTIDEFITNLSNDGEDAIIPSITISGKVSKGESMDNISDSEPSAKLKFGTLGYFKDNKLVGFLSSDESTGYNFLAKTQYNTYINFKCDDKNYATVRVSDSKLDEKLSFENNKPLVNIKSNIKVDLLEYNCPADFINNEKYVKKIENKVSKKVETLMKKATNKLYKEEDSDVLRYGTKFYAKKYKEMKKLGYKKNNIPNDIKFKINVKAKVNTIKLSIKSVKENVKYE